MKGLPCMKFLLYTLIYPPDTCSNAFVFADLTKALIDAGDEVTVITTTPHYDEEHAIEKKECLVQGKRKWYRTSEYSGVKVFHIDVAPYKGSTKERIKTFYRFHKYCIKLVELEELDYEVVLCQTPPMTIGFDCIHLAKKRQAVSVMILQDLWLDAMIHANRVNGLLVSVLRRIEKKEYQNIDLITTIDEAMGRRVKEISGIQPHIIPNFVDKNAYKPKQVSIEERKRYGISENQYVISYIGNIGEAQDLEPLIQYAKHNPEIKIFVAGNGKNEQYYKDRVKKEDINTIIFLGYITREEASVINALSDVCMVMLAEHISSTSFPSKIYSLMSMGKPIFITCADDNSAGKFIENNKIGWRALVSNYAQINTLLDSILNNRDERIMRGVRARELVLNNYSSESVVKQYKDIIIQYKKSIHNS